MNRRRHSSRLQWRATVLRRRTAQQFQYQSFKNDSQRGSTRIGTLGYVEHDRTCEDYNPLAPSPSRKQSTSLCLYVRKKNTTGCALLRLVPGLVGRRPAESNPTGPGDQSPPLGRRETMRRGIVEIRKATRVRFEHAPRRRPRLPTVFGFLRSGIVRPLSSYGNGSL